MNKILGISAFYHDSAAAIVIDGEVIAAAHEERFTREKHTAEFPKNAVEFCLKQAKLKLKDLDAVVFYDKPLLKFERLLESYYAFAPKGLSSFLKSMPVWLKEKLFLKKLLYDELKQIDSFDKKKLKFLFTEHHLAHAASAFYPSGFKEAAVLTIDGVGEWATASISIANYEKFELIQEMQFPHSVGLLYSAFTYFLGFKVNSGEYKLMGLAPYGNETSNETINFIALIKKYLVDIKKDGSIWLNQDFFNYTVGLTMVNEVKWKKIFGLTRREESEEISQSHCNLAIAIQKVTEEIVLKMAKETKRLTKSENLCLAGGVALNCVANEKIINEKLFTKVFIQPASGDAGGALGAALSAYYLINKNSKNQPLYNSNNYSTSLGSHYSNLEIEDALNQLGANYKLEKDFDKLCFETAKLIRKGCIIGWFQGKAEFGPRALGNRSILGNPSFNEMQKRLNLKIKYRESFRPFAPSVLKEDASLYFELNQDSDFMLQTAQFKKDWLFDLPDSYNDLKLKEKLYQKRSNFQAVTHLDLSARVQTVDKLKSPRFWQLLLEVKKITGHGMVVNTSFNVRNEPIVNCPRDAFSCFMATDMDYLVIGNYILKKEAQKDWQNKKKWMKNYKND